MEKLIALALAVLAAVNAAFGTLSIPQLSPRRLPDTIVNETTGEEYSARSLIVCYEADADTAALEDAFSGYGLSVTYRLTDFCMYALSAERNLSETELKALIRTLEQLPGVLSVSRDYVMHTDGPADETLDNGAVLY